MLDMDPITLDETKKLEQLREKLNGCGLSQFQLQNKCLARWLRARNGNLEDAENMIRKHIEWRKEYNVENTNKWIIDDYVYDEIQWGMTGYARDGSPIMYFPIGQMDLISVVSKGFKEDFKKYVLKFLEEVKQFVEKKSKGRDTLLQVVCVVDLKGLSFRTVTNPTVVETVLELVKHFEANFPELLHTCIVLNTPYVFQIFWRVCKVFVTERTVSKLRFLNSNVATWKKNLMEIAEEDQFLEEHGGTVLEWLQLASEDGELKETLNGNHVTSTEAT